MKVNMIMSNTKTKHLKVQNGQGKGSMQSNSEYWTIIIVVCKSHIFNMKVKIHFRIIISIISFRRIYSNRLNLTSKFQNE
jgi:hypothetical protein